MNDACNLLMMGAQKWMDEWLTKMKKSEKSILTWLQTRFLHLAVKLKRGRDKREREREGNC